ncbi:uncharacterized protein Dwil_GK24324 [Drosophila willistoni]|uniref:LRRNT domain-containing protein n=1 Tax=Drosophila willistoni TaxID=7260 RepID=B4MZS0_DROWI|nr:uncharacterized protein LOC6643784 [Drosophila willistoni]XP_023032561.1 uncharacterized protein LOC6643784 [Drosophila willistoni]XP_046866727.1 uncharacterized protein LOC6643784 [Drosophila willistoni]EDW77855.2 uncharacterized protein Dwil_GK24324 [Drosophila willistoni]
MLFLWLFLFALCPLSTRQQNHTSTYVTKAGCEALIKDRNLCECQDGEIKCEKIQLNSDAKELYSINCNVFDVRGFGYIPPLQVGKISKLSINNCALPNARSVKELITTLGITNYTELEINNFFDFKKSDKGDVLQQRYTNQPGLKKLTILGFKSALPANYFENLSELKDLSMQGSGDLPGTILYPLTKLTKLNIVVRNMHKVASEIFSKQTKLRHLTIHCDVKNSSVEMSTFASQELWHMPELQSFELFQCGDNIPAEMFWKSHELAYLSIRSNISYLGREFLKAQQKLLTLKLERNNIARLPDQLFHHSPMLLEIHLAYNNLDRIQSGLFDKLKNLQILNLEQNPITTISPTAFTAIPKAHIYLGQLYRVAGNADWARNTNATICEEEYIYGVCIYCRRDEYLDHFSDKEICNKPTIKSKDVIIQKKYDNRMAAGPTHSWKKPAKYPQLNKDDK